MTGPGRSGPASSGPGGAGEIKLPPFTVHEDDWGDLELVPAAHLRGAAASTYIPLESLGLCLADLRLPEALTPAALQVRPPDGEVRGRFAYGQPSGPPGGVYGVQRLGVLHALYLTSHLVTPVFTDLLLDWGRRLDLTLLDWTRERLISLTDPDALERYLTGEDEPHD